MVTFKSIVVRHIVTLSGNPAKKMKVVYHMENYICLKFRKKYLKIAMYIQNYSIPSLARITIQKQKQKHAINCVKKLKKNMQSIN